MPSILESTALFLFACTIGTFASAVDFPHPARPTNPLGCVATNSCPECTAPARDCKPRVRRNWSSLTDEEKGRFIAATKTIKNTPADEGRERYGPDFTNYNEFIVRHAASATDPRGDQAHLDQHFVLWHRLFTLKFENTLLAVDPSLKGLPYWDLREGLDVVFGPGPLEFGSTTGTGPANEIVDGAFTGDDWKVSPYDEAYTMEAQNLPDDFLSQLNLSNFTGTTLLRSSDVPSDSLVRFPSCTNDGPSPLIYSQDDFEICASQSSIEGFYWCLESPVSNGVHEVAHAWIGSADSEEYGWACPNFAGPNLSLPGVRQGDYIDKSTSPNDPIFMLHHSFIDMLAMDFMRRNPQDAELYYGFKTSASTDQGPPVTEGTFLKDVVASAWPFEGYDLLKKSPGAPQGPLRYWELMCWVGPETAMYTYDSFEDSICVEEAEDSSSSSESSSSEEDSEDDVAAPQMKKKSAKKAKKDKRKSKKSKGE